MTPPWAAAQPDRSRAQVRETGWGPRPDRVAGSDRRGGGARMPAARSLPAAACRAELALVVRPRDLNTYQSVFGGRSRARRGRATAA